MESANTTVAARYVYVPQSTETLAKIITGTHASILHCVTQILAVVHKAELVASGMSILFAKRDTGTLQHVKDAFNVVLTNEVNSSTHDAC